MQWYDAEWFIDAGSTGTFISCLLAGHVLADFIFQSEKMVQCKHRPIWLVLHVLIVILVQFVCLLPFYSFDIFMTCIGIGLTHGMIDWLKIKVGAKILSSLNNFLVDQFLHLLVLLCVLAFYFDATILSAGAYSLEAMQAFTRVFLGITMIALLYNGAAATVNMQLRRYKSKLPAPAQDDFRNPARLIGILERMLIFILVLVDQWVCLGLLLLFKATAKSADLRHDANSNYFLIGTMNSALIAVLCGIFLRLGV